MRERHCYWWGAAKGGDYSAAGAKSWSLLVQSRSVTELEHLAVSRA